MGLSLISSLLLASWISPTLDATEVWAIDFLGPTAKPADGREVNSAAHYWTDIVGIPFTRDAKVDLPPTPLDLDLDRKPDTTFGGTWNLPGGILNNPKLVGLVPTPADPKGTVGTYSISTGFLGIREEKDPVTARGTGRFGFTCWLCHGGADESGRIVLGKPNTRIDLGLILASSYALDPHHVIRASPDGPPLKSDELQKREALDNTFDFDTNHDDLVTIAEWRAGMKLPTTDETRAAVLLAGPGRLDQSVDHRMDGTIPLANLQHYTLEKIGSEEYLRKAKLPKRAVFNPVSLPQIVPGLGIAHYAWTGKDSSMRHDAVDIVMNYMKVTPNELADLIKFPRTGDVDYEALSRALTLDFRNVGTAGREADDVEGNWWSYNVLNKPDRATLTTGAERFGAVPLRELLTKPRAAMKMDDPLVEQGLKIFTERVVGEIINQRVVSGREAHTPDEVKGIAVVVPLDRSKPISEKIPVRCATCHNHSPLSVKRPIATPLDLFQRCDVCHFDHPDGEHSGRFVSLARHMEREGIKTVDDCLKCHDTHRDFGLQAYSNSWLLPLDANGNGSTHGDEGSDSMAGGIGTDALVNIDTLFVVQIQPAARRPKRMYLVTDNALKTPTKEVFSSQGYGWIRVAPLAMVGATSPYLHNGSVPTLDDLFKEPEQRSKKFRVGLPEQNFTYDASLPGNRNTGHRFGLDLSEHEKKAVIRFLEAIP